MALAAEIADGWLPIFMSPTRFGIYEESLRGMKDDFDIAATVTVILTDDVAAALMPIKANLAFYMGGMGAPEQNFHVNLLERMGFGETVKRVQELFLSGKRAEAVAAVPDELADEISLVGPAERIRERLKAWHQTPVSTLMVGSQDPAVLRLMAETLL